MQENKEIEYKNPFPVTAVASFHNDKQNYMIVETKAIKQMKEITDRWISDKSDGITVVVQGEYGTGKTQLAIEMQKHIKQYDSAQYHFICLDSPSAGFLEMYKNRFLNELTKEEVLNRLEDCYREIIIEDLKKDRIYKAFIQEREDIKSLELIEKLGLAKSRYDAIFESKLERVTKNVKFVPALLLLLDLGFKEDAWSWFNGDEPSVAMRERGVRFSINDDVSALESIGIFAFLFGQQGHTFVLFIDEVEKIVSSTERIGADSFEALKKLIETTKATKSMLILCGLPDHYAALPRDVQQRIAYQVKTEKIVLPEIEEYVRNANENVNNERNCNPFSISNLEDILNISNGNIRSAIRILYHSGNWYMKNKSVIDENAMREILTDTFGSFELSDIKKRLTQIFISKGWPYEENKAYGNTEIDFCLPSAYTKKEMLNNCIEIYLIQNILSEKDYDEICKRKGNEGNNCQIFIIEGFINKKYIEYLSHGNKYVLIYRVPEFRESLIALIEGEKTKCDERIKQSDYSAINEKIERLSKNLMKAINDLNKNFIGKKEFHYYMKSLLDLKKEEFYALPDKDSEFYLLVNEIHKVIEACNKYTSDKGEIGVLYLIKEFSYILYYVFEKPQELQICIKNVNEYEVYRNVHRLVTLFFQDFGAKLRKATSRYRLVLDYLCEEDEEKATHFFNLNDKNTLLWNMVYEGDFFSISKQVRQVSQNFCAELLIKRPDIIVRYEELFISFYNLIYVTVPAVIGGEMVAVDMGILREYCDLLRKYFKGYWIEDSEQVLSKLFDGYIKELGRMMYERG
ncbi:MAG: ATP-binding protein [Lachnospiraceae bacterium]|nr:ATP-binding protein [Lachnospiraceae bacterium]